MFNINTNLNHNIKLIRFYFYILKFEIFQKIFEKSTNEISSST